MTTTANNVEVTVPDIGDFSDVPVIEVLVSVGDKVNADDPVITLESDKATMDVPAPIAGTVTEVLVAVGDQRQQGHSVILLIAPGEGAVTPPPSLVEQQEPAPATRRSATPAAPTGRGGPGRPRTTRRPRVRTPGRRCGGWPASWASTSPPSRRPGPKGRITKDDLLSFLQGPGRRPPPRRRRLPRAAGIPEVPAQDFAAFGPGRDASSCRGSSGCRARTCTAAG